MSQVKPQPLTFASVDDISFAAARDRLKGRGLGAMFAVNDLGPLLEFAQLAAGGLLPPIDGVPWLSLDGVGGFYAALISERSRWLCPNSRRIGFFRTAAAPPKDEATWIGFGLAAQQAAVSVGFPRKVAAQLVGALGEMQSNIYEHSGVPATGVVVFKARPGGFEFVVTDRGVGVLDSLRSCSEYAHLTDHGDALRLALTDGVSRHGLGSNHGKGFRQLFIGLANLNGALRFRSGDHALTIDTHGPSLMRAKLAEKPEISGFFVSVACVLGASSNKAVTIAA